MINVQFIIKTILTQFVSSLYQNVDMRINDSSKQKQEQYIIETSRY